MFFPGHRCKIDELIHGKTILSAMTEKTAIYHTLFSHRMTKTFDTIDFSCTEPYLLPIMLSVLPRKYFIYKQWRSIVTISRNTSSGTTTTTSHTYFSNKSDRQKKYQLKEEWKKKYITKFLLKKNFNYGMILAQVSTYLPHPAQHHNNVIFSSLTT